MCLRAPLLALVLVFLATACHEDVPLPPLEEEPPSFAFSLYLEDGQLRPNADVLLVRRPKHLDHVYARSRAGDKEPGREQARQLFGIIEAEFKNAGVYVANQVVSLRCAAVELPDCVPRWSFIRRYHVEYNTPVSGRGPAHQSRATSNDPNAEIILLIVP